MPREKAVIEQGDAKIIGKVSSNKKRPSYLRFVKNAHNRLLDEFELLSIFVSSFLEYSLDLAPLYLAFVARATSNKNKVFSIYLFSQNVSQGAVSHFFLCAKKLPLLVGPPEK